MLGGSGRGSARPVCLLLEQRGRSHQGSGAPALPARSPWLPRALIGPEEKESNSGREGRRAPFAQLQEQSWGAGCRRVPVTDTPATQHSHPTTASTQPHPGDGAGTGDLEEAHGEHEEPVCSVGLLIFIVSFV